MNKITNFKHEVFGQIRTMTQENGEIMFVGKDVATALGYSKPQNALATHVDKEDKSTAPIQGTAYETRAVLINESGLYALVLSSKLPQAKAFKRWVTSEVLQPLRDHVGKPLIVNSGYRTVALNNYLKGAKNSYHIYGCAADLRMDNWEMAYDCASFVTRELPFNEVIISKRDSSIWLHVAYRMGDTKRYVGFWEY